MELLFKKGALVDASNEVYETPLHLAAMQGHTGLVELLLKKGALIGTENQDGMTHYFLPHRMAKLV